MAFNNMKLILSFAYIILFYFYLTGRVSGEEETLIFANETEKIKKECKKSFDRSHQQDYTVKSIDPQGTGEPNTFYIHINVTVTATKNSDNTEKTFGGYFSTTPDGKPYACLFH